MGKSNRTHQNPPIIEDLGDGTFYYNFDVVESVIETENNQEGEGDPQFDYEQVRCEYPVTEEKIQECLDKENYEHQVDLTGYEEI